VSGAATGVAPVAGPLDGLQVDLDVFVGPFDLLVTLILRDEVDLWEVRVSHIVAEYVLRLAESEEFDLEATSHFIVLVTALLEMKSRRLLDAGNPFLDELEGLDEESAGEELLATLLRYARFKGAAARLGELFERHAGRLYRATPVPRRFLRGASAGPALPASALPHSLDVLLEEPPAPDASHITDIAVTLVAELRRLRALLLDEETFTFSAVAPRDRVEKAVTFFALLELHNQGEVRLRQARPFAEITVSRTAGAGPKGAGEWPRGATSTDGWAGSGDALAVVG
jgi:segregation and condensation protein A